jgi:hypothetical protein
MLQFYCTVQGTETLFFRMTTPLKDFSAPAAGFPGGLWPRFEEELQKQVIAQFAESGGPSGAWPALSDKPPGKGYASRKATQYPGAGILVASGELMASFVQGGAGHVFESRPMGMTWGSTNPLAGYHQRGHSTPTPLPQRKLFDWDSGLAGNLRSASLAYMRARYRQVGIALADAGLGPRAAGERGGLSGRELSDLGQSYFESMAL